MSSGSYNVKPSKQCGREKSDGSPCRAPKIKGRDACKDHANSDVFRGNLVLDKSGETRKLQTFGDVVDLLEAASNMVLTEKIDAHQGKAVASLSMAAIKAIEMRDRKGGSGNDLNSREALEMIMRGVGAGMAREVLASRNFKLLQTPEQIYELTPQQKAHQLVVELGGEEEDASKEMDLKEIRGSDKRSSDAGKNSSAGEGVSAPGDIFE